MPGGARRWPTAFKRRPRHRLARAGPGHRAAGCRALWFDHAHVMLMGPAPDPGLAEVAALVDQSDAWAVVRLDGDDAADVLARLTPLDLRKEHFKRGHTARSELAHMPAAITRIGAQRLPGDGVPRHGGDHGARDARGDAGGCSARGRLTSEAPVRCMARQVFAMMRLVILRDWSLRLAASAGRRGRERRRNVPRAARRRRRWWRRWSRSAPTARTMQDAIGAVRAAHADMDDRLADTMPLLADWVYSVPPEQLGADVAEASRRPALPTRVEPRRGTALAHGQARALGLYWQV
ncbi:MAG: hypothetical protein U5K36_01705 [Roseovarius sp.]|nr:hypothetical protein [Roseovarius sp.]